MSGAPRSFRACLLSREKHEWNNACSEGYFISLVYPFRNHWRLGKSASGSQQCDLPPNCTIFCSESHLFPS